MTFTLRLSNPWNPYPRVQTKRLSSGTKNCCRNSRGSIFPEERVGTIIESMCLPSQFWSSEVHSWESGAVGLRSHKAEFTVFSITKAKNLRDGMSKLFAISARRSCGIQPPSQGMWGQQRTIGFSKAAYSCQLS